MWYFGGISALDDEVSTFDVTEFLQPLQKGINHRCAARRGGGE
jgi:hypothetical protein